MPNVVSLRIGGQPASGVVRFDQTKAFSKHTTAVVDLSYPGSSLQPWIAPEWSPVEVFLGSTTWYGYVHHGGVVTDVRDRSGGAVIRYTLIGTSLPMNEGRTRSWKGVTRSSIVRQIAREHRLRSVVTTHGSVMDYYAQTGISDWKVLQQMAEGSGYRLWVDGATVLFVNPTLLLEGVKALSIPTFSQNRTFGLRDNLYSFTSKAGTMVPRATGTTAKRALYGIDPRTGRVIKATGAPTLGSGSPIGQSPTLTRVDTTSRIGNTAQAADTIAAQVANTAGWITATALVAGAADVVPGMVVNIQGTKVPQDQTGRWMVTSVNHRVINDLSETIDPFTSTLELERDHFYGPNITSATRTSNTRDSVAAKIRNGYLWESDYLESVNVG